MKCFFTDDPKLLGETDTGYGVMITPRQKKLVDLLIEMLSNEFEVPIPMLYSQVRTDKVATPRMLTVWFAGTAMGLDRTESAAIFYKDLNYLYLIKRNIQNRIDVDKNFSERVDKLRLKVGRLINDMSSL